MHHRLLVTALGAILAASDAVGQAPIGPEFKVNSTAALYNEFASVANDASTGRFTVTWALKDMWVSIQGRTFDAAGNPIGLDFVINETTPGEQSRSGGPRVAYEGAGGFVVVWSGSANVMARRYDAAGAPRGPEFVVGPPGNQSFPDPRVGAGAAGRGFVVVWRDNSTIRARVYDASGNGMPPIDIITTNSWKEAAMTPDGGFVVAWATTSPPYVIWARLFDAAAVPRGAAFPVSQSTNFKYQLALATDGTGGFTVAWHEYGSGDWDVGVLARKFDSSGNPLTGETIVNMFVPGLQKDPKVAVAPSGEALVTWNSFPFVTCPPPPFPCPPWPPSQDGDGSGVFGRRFDAAGSLLGAEFQVNSYTTGDQRYPAVALDAGGRMTVVWQDTPRRGIYARRFSSLVPAAFDVDRVAGAGSNGNRVFEPGETVALEPAWHNTMSVPLTYSSAAASLSGPAGPTYSLPDASAGYGTFNPNTSLGCRDAGDCYSASITGARPGQHWDAVLSEAMVPAGHASREWAVHVGESFEDVPVSSIFYRFVETLLHNGVSGGCDAAGNYCPGASVLREQMPVFVLRSYVPSLVPPACVAGSEMFADVPASSPYCRWIEELARRAVVTGCGGGNYCPALAVSRETMAVYLGATLGLDPPACGTPVFADVPASSPYCRWIEELVRRGVVAGCGGGNYCPAMAVTREQMAVFLTATFGLSLYGP